MLSELPPPVVKKNYHQPLLAQTNCRFKSFRPKSGNAFNIIYRLLKLPFGLYPTEFKIPHSLAKAFWSLAQKKNLFSRFGLKTIFKSNYLVQIQGSTDFFVYKGVAFLVALILPIKGKVPRFICRPCALKKRFLWKLPCTLCLFRSDFRFNQAVFPLIKPIHYCFFIPTKSFWYAKKMLGFKPVMLFWVVAIFHLFQ